MKKHKKNNIPLFFIIPALLLYSLFVILPILVMIFSSFTNWDGFVQNEWSFIGLKNYINLFQDDRFLHSIFVTLQIMITVTIVANVGGLSLALLLNKNTKFNILLRIIFFSPYILSTVAVAYIWLSMLSYTGAVNSVLSQIGLMQFQNDFIGNGKSAIISICIIEIWRTVGFYMVIYLASLKTVPTELYEVCKIDGGNKWQTFRYITLPHIVPGITVCILMSIIIEMKLFDLVKIMTDGGPGYSTETITYYTLTQAFNTNRIGYSSAAATLLTIIIAVLALFQTKIISYLQRRRKY